MERADVAEEHRGGDAANPEVDGVPLHVLARARHLVPLLAQHQVVLGGGAGARRGGGVGGGRGGGRGFRRGARGSLRRPRGGRGARGRGGGGGRTGKAFPEVSGATRRAGRPRGHPAWALQPPAITPV